ncbi:MAG: DUF6320 domain-containing protein [Bacteroidales bacterium]
MAICRNCGVEIEEELEVCPLCGKVLKGEFKDESEFSNIPTDILTLQRKENRRSLWELTGITVLSAIAVCTFIDIFAGKGVRWSLYTDIILPGIWLFLTFILFTHRKPWIMLPGIALTVTGILAGIDLASSGHDWFIPVGLPVTIAVFTASLIIVFLYKKAVMTGLNLIGALFILAAFICLVTEVSVDLFVNNSVKLSWSVYVTISAFPVSSILFYYHYRLKRGNRLDSLFHI